MEEREYSFMYLLDMKYANTHSGLTKKLLLTVNQTCVVEMNLPKPLNDFNDENGEIALCLSVQ